MSTDRSLELLVKELSQMGYVVLHEEAAQAVVALREGNSFVLLDSGDWLHIAAMLVERQRLTRSKHRSAVGELVLRLHARFLGCRLGYDEDENLVLQRDVYPDTRHAAHVDIVLTQMSYVGVVVLPLVERALGNGNVPTESEIEAAFEPN